MIRRTYFPLLLAVLSAFASAQTNNSQPARKNTVPTLDAIFSSLDQDEDGRISRAEATGMYAQRFDQWDADKDGFASREEVRAHRRSQGLDDNSQRTSPQAQKRNATAANPAKLLPEPADWRFEAMSLPPGFARDITLTGDEEIRFAPRVFDPTSPTYFTCVIALRLDKPSASLAELQEFLDKYYRGLSSSVGQRNGMKFDLTQSKAGALQPDPAGTVARPRYQSDVVFFDPFSAGRKITLHIETRVLPKAAVGTGKPNVLLLVSPSPRDHANWTTLHEIAAKTGF